MDNKLSDAEFEIMKVLWKYDTFISSDQIMKSLEDKKQWKPQTILTLLSRLIKKKFVELNKKNNRNYYKPIVLEKTYLEFETNNFFNKFHDSSLIGLVNSLYISNQIEDSQIKQLKKLLNEYESDK